MALRVWLPLNGSLENKGISDIIPVLMGNGITFSNGKIGQAATFPNNCNSCIYFSGLKLQIFSWSCWFYCSGEGSGTSQRILSEGRDTGSIGTNIWVSKAGTTLYWSTHKKTGAIAISLNTWYHVALTCDNSNIYFYLNGELKSTTSYTEDSDYAQSNDMFVLGKMAYSYTNTSYYFPFNGKLNDVRIYNHCLSSLEVKEISQGLVLHYKLDGFSGGAGENILTGTNHNSYNSSLNATTAINANGKWCGGSGGNGTFSVIEDLTCPVGNLIWNISNNTSGNRDFQQGNQPYVGGQQYTTSFWAKGNGTCLYRSWNSTDGKQMFSKTWTLTSNWTYYTHTFTASAEMETDLCTFHLGVTGNSNISICGMKMELGSIATPWTPAPKDLGINTTKIIDSSGYGNDGILTGILENSADTSRYQLSSFFNGNDTAIQIPYNATIWQDNFTMNLWFKKDELGSKNYETLIGGPSGFEIDTRVNNATTLSLYMTSTRGGNAYSPFNFGEWYMITLVNDGTNELYYVNGALVKTIEKKSMPTGNYFIGAWQTNIKQNYKGNISDFRIYATALSAEDIAMLYHTPAQIDNLGGIHGFEINEIETSNLSDFALISSNWVSDGVTATYSEEDMGPIVKIVPSSGYKRIYHNVSNVWTNEKSYIVSMIAKADTDGAILRASRSLANFAPNFNLTTSWKKYYGIITSTITTDSGTLSIDCQTSTNYYITDIKLEEANLNLISMLKNGIIKENWIDENNFNNNAKFLKESSIIIGNTFIEK